jgi:hypothetical protein
VLPASSKTARVSAGRAIRCYAITGNRPEPAKLRDYRVGQRRIIAITLIASNAKINQIRNTGRLSGIA